METALGLAVRQGGSLPRQGGFRRGKDRKLILFRVVSLTPQLQSTEAQVGAGRKREEPGKVRTGTPQSKGVYFRVVHQDQDRSQLVCCDELAFGPKEGAERGLAFVPSGGTDQGIHTVPLCSSQGCEVAGKETY